MITHVLVCALALVACKKDDAGWTQFNSDDDFLEIAITSSEEVIEVDGCELGTTCIDLHSRIEGATIGTASVDPSSGPVGTKHKVLAVVGDDWEDQVGLVSVSVDSDRGEQTYDLEQDRANPGAWGITLESVGASGKSGEERIDIFTVLLWEEDVSTKNEDEE